MIFFFAQRIFFESRFSSLSKKFCFHRPLLVNQGLLLSSKALCLNQSFLVDQHVLLIIYLLQITVSVWINATPSSFLKVFLLINVFFLNLVYSDSPCGTPGVLGIGNRHRLQIGAPVSRLARQKFVFGKVSAGGNSSSVGNSSAGKVSPSNINIINSSLKWYSAAPAKRATLNADIMQLSPELMPRLFCCLLHERNMNHCVIWHSILSSNTVLQKHDIPQNSRRVTLMETKLSFAFLQVFVSKFGSLKIQWTSKKRSIWVG